MWPSTQNHPIWDASVHPPWKRIILWILTAINRQAQARLFERTNHHPWVRKNLLPCHRQSFHNHRPDFSYAESVVFVSPPKFLTRGVFEKKSQSTGEMTKYQVLLFCDFLYHQTDRGVKQEPRENVTTSVNIWCW